MIDPLQIRDGLKEPLRNLIIMFLIIQIQGVFEKRYSIKHFEIAKEPQDVYPFILFKSDFEDPLQRKTDQCDPLSGGRFVGLEIIDARDLKARQRGEHVGHLPYRR